MSFRINAQRKFYIKAVMLLIQQAFVAFSTLRDPKEDRLSPLPFPAHRGVEPCESP